MIDLARIRKQVLRFGGLNFPPTTPEGWLELCKVLQRRCQTMDHIERVIDRWIENEEDVPKPVQLSRLCADVPADPTIENLILPPACDECGPEGLWRFVERIGPDGVPVSAYARCLCARGRQLAVADAKRALELEEAAKKRKQPGSLTRIDGPRKEIG